MNVIDLIPMLCETRMGIQYIFDSGSCGVCDGLR